MLKKILFLLITLLISVNCYAENTNRITVGTAITHDTLKQYSTIGVPTTGTSITDSISLVNPGVTSIGVMYKATSSGVVSVTLQALRSFQRPSVEGTSDSSYVLWNTSNTITDTAWHMATLDTVVMPYLVFKANGTGSNDDSTTIQIKVAQQ